MAEFDDKLNELLSNPDSMAQIMRLAQSLSGDSQGGGAGEQEPPPRSAPQHHHQEPPPQNGGGDLLSSLTGGVDPKLLMRLLPLIHQAVATAVEAGEQQERLAADTLRDHALLLEFFRRRDGAGAEHAMAIHMRHAMDGMGLE